MAEYLQKYKRFPITTHGGEIGRYVEQHVVQHAMFENEHVLFDSMFFWAAYFVGSHAWMVVWRKLIICCVGRHDGQNIVLTVKLGSNLGSMLNSIRCGEACCAAYCIGQHARQYVVLSGMMGSKLAVFGNQLVSMLHSMSCSAVCHVGRQVG